MDGGNRPSEIFYVCAAYNDIDIDEKSRRDAVQAVSTSSGPCMYASYQGILGHTTILQTYHSRTCRVYEINVFITPYTRRRPPPSLPTLRIYSIFRKLSSLVLFLTWVPRWIHRRNERNHSSVVNERGRTIFIEYGIYISELMAVRGARE